MALLPGQRLDRSAELLRDALGAGKGAVDEPDFPRTLLREAVANGSRAAARADHHDGPDVRAPAGLLLPYVLDEAVAVVVGAGERPIGPDDHAADRAYAFRQRVDLVDDGHRPFLVRDRQVAARESQGVKRAQGGDEALGPDRERHVGSGQVVPFEPVAVQHRRARVHDGPAHDAGQQEAIGVRHRHIFSCI